jgi:hypothetical protein
LEHPEKKRFLRFAQNDKEQRAPLQSFNHSPRFGRATPKLFPQHFVGIWCYLVMNCCMVRPALAVALNLVAVCLPVAAQQANRPAAMDPTLALSVSQPNILRAKNSSLLFHKGPVRAWSDGGRLASESAFASISITPLDLPPLAYFTPNAFGPAPTRNGRAASDSRSNNFAADTKDSPEMMLSPPDRFYYGGEIGFMYGRWSGKGSGDMMESYIMGQAGNDHFQITAGAAFEQWSGNGARFRSFALPR